jgi:ribosome-binding factor A
MGVRHVPELTFLADRSGRFQARIEELMGRQRKRQKAQAQLAPVGQTHAAEPKVQVE